MEVLENIWQLSILRKALQPVSAAPSNSAVLTIVGAPPDTAKKLLETIMQMSLSNADLSKGEPMTASKDACREFIVEEKRIEDEKDQNNGFEN